MCLYGTGRYCYTNACIYNPFCRLMLWMKGKGGPIQGDPQNLHRIALSCFSDFLMPSPIFMKFPQLRRNHSLIASLDHSIWFHAPVHVDQWHLFVQDCDRAVGENALTICRYALYYQRGHQVSLLQLMDTRLYLLQDLQCRWYSGGYLYPGITQSFKL